MKKSKFKVFLIVLALVLGLSFYVYDGYNNAPSRLKVNYRSIQSEKIHKDLDGLQVAFMSDLHYLGFFDDSRLDNLIETVNASNPDVLIFLGDLITREMNEEEYQKLLNSLKSIDVKYGKFAVLGEADYKSEAITKQVSDILYAADFEILDNKSVKITKDTQASLQLVGINNPYDNYDDIDMAYEHVSEENFTITVMHTPDTVEELPYNLSDLVVAGHSLGGQIKIPLLGQVYNKTLAEKYYSGLYRVRDVKLFVTNGVGTVDQDVRINAPAEIVVYTLRSGK